LIFLPKICWIRQETGLMDDKVVKPSKLWRGVLVVSLALNLAVIGVLGGAAVAGRFGDGPPGRIDLGLGPVARALPEDQRRAIGRALRQDRATGGMDFRGQMAAMTAALRADPYDPDVMRQLLEDQAARLSQVQARARSAMLDQIAAMPPEARQRFADRLEAEVQPRRPPRAREGG
jgi:uncharacterized membrane protein